MKDTLIRHPEWPRMPQDKAMQLFASLCPPAHVSPVIEGDPNKVEVRKDGAVFMFTLRHGLILACLFIQKDGTEWTNDTLDLNDEERQKLTAMFLPSKGQAKVITDYRVFWCEDGKPPVLITPGMNQGYSKNRLRFPEEFIATGNHFTSPEIAQQVANRYNEYRKDCER